MEKPKERHIKSEEQVVKEVNNFIVTKVVPFAVVGVVNIMMIVSIGVFLGLLFGVIPSSSEKSGGQQKFAFIVVFGLLSLVFSVLSEACTDIYYNKTLLGMGAKLLGKLWNKSLLFLVRLSRR